MMGFNHWEVFSQGSIFGKDFLVLFVFLYSYETLALRICHLNLSDINALDLTLAGKHI